MNMKLTLNNLFFPITFISGFTSLVFYSNPIIMGLLIGLQCCILLISLYKGKNEAFICYFTIFVIMGQEFAYFLDADISKVTMYSFKETRIAGLNLALVFCLLFFAKLIFVDKALSIINLKKNYIYLFKWMLFIVMSGIIMGCFNVFTNNNGIKALPGIWTELFSEASYGVFVLALFFSYVYTLRQYGCERIEKCLLAIVLCNLLVPFAANLLGVVGAYGGKEMYLTFSAYLLCTIVIIFPCFKKYASKAKYIYAFWAVGVAYPLLFESIAYGKLLLIVFASIILFLYYKSYINAKWLLVTSVLFVCMLFLWKNVVEFLTENNDLFGYKYKQVLSLISFWKEGWYEQMLPSPKVRITEFANIFLELVQNPFYFLFGKGYLGTCRDYMQAIKSYDLSVYSLNEFEIGAFYGMHESINIFFLANGICGIMFLLRYIKTFINGFRKSPWIVIGGVWLVFLWGYSVTRATLGVACLCVGLYQISIQEGKVRNGHEKGTNY